jgi:hypothetical protein
MFSQSQESAYDYDDDDFDVIDREDDGDDCAFDDLDWGYVEQRRPDLYARVDGVANMDYLSPADEQYLIDEMAGVMSRIRERDAADTPKYQMSREHATPVFILEGFAAWSHLKWPHSLDTALDGRVYYHGDIMLITIDDGVSGDVGFLNQCWEVKQSELEYLLESGSIFIQ